MPPDEMDAKKKVLEDIMAFAQEKRAGQLKSKYGAKPQNPNIEPIPGVVPAAGVQAPSPEDELAQLLPQ